MQPQKNSNEPKPTGYGKRPLWQWILLYVVVAGLLYVAIYLLFFHHGASGGYSY